MQLRGRSGEYDDDGVRGLQHQSGRSAGETEVDCTLRDGRLLANSVLEVDVRTAAATRERTRDRSDLRVQVVVQMQLHTGDPRDQLDGPIVVRRSESSGDDAQIRA